MLYENLSIDPARKKLAETPEILDAVEWELLDKTLKTLGNKGFYHSSTFNEKELNLIKKIVTTLPETHLLPVFDIFRMFLAHPHSNEMFKYYAMSLEPLVRVLEILKSSPPDNLILISLRVLCNFFKNNNAHYMIN